MRKEIERSFFQHNLIAQSLSVKYAHILESQFDHQVVIKECVRIWWLFDGSYLMANWWIKLWLKHVRIFDGYLMGHLDLSFSVGSVIFSWIWHAFITSWPFKYAHILQSQLDRSISFRTLSLLSSPYSLLTSLEECTYMRVSPFSPRIYTWHIQLKILHPRHPPNREMYACIHIYIYICAKHMHARMYT